MALGAPAVHHGEVRLSAAQRRARVILLVNGADVVPRLLGSPLSTTDDDTPRTRAHNHQESAMRRMMVHDHPATRGDARGRRGSAVEYGASCSGDAESSSDEGDREGPATTISPRLHEGAV